MVRTAKNDKAPTTTPAAKKTAAPAKKTTTKTSKEEAPVKDAAPVAASVANEVVEEATGIQHKLNEFSAKLQQINSIFSSLKGDFKTLEKAV